MVLVWGYFEVKVIWVFLFYGFLLKNIGVVFLYILVFICNLFNM